MQPKRRRRLFPRIHKAFPRERRAAPRRKLGLGRIHGFVLTFACLAALGCAPGQHSPPLAVAPPPVAGAGKGMVYAYWPEGLLQSLMPDVGLDDLKSRYSILVDGKSTGSICMGEYLAVEVEPGKHIVYFSSGFDLFGLAASGKVGTTIHATPGSSHYFQMSWNGKYAEMAERPERDGREVVPGLKRRPMDLTQPAPAPPIKPAATIAPG